MRRCLFSALHRPRRRYLSHPLPCTLHPLLRRAGHTPLACPSPLTRRRLVARRRYGRAMQRALLPVVSLEGWASVDRSPGCHWLLLLLLLLLCPRLVTRTRIGTTSRLRLAVRGRCILLHRRPSRSRQWRRRRQCGSCLSLFRHSRRWRRIASRTCPLRRSTHSCSSNSRCTCSSSHNHNHSRLNSPLHPLPMALTTTTSGTSFRVRPRRLVTRT